MAVLSYVEENNTNNTLFSLGNNINNMVTVCSTEINSNTQATQQTIESTRL